MSAPYSYDVHLPDGTVATVAASSMQVDDSGTLGLFNDEGHMVASWIKGDWKLSAPSSEPKPAPVEQLAPEPVIHVEVPPIETVAHPGVEPLGHDEPAEPPAAPVEAPAAHAEPEAEPQPAAQAEPPAEHAP